MRTMEDIASYLREYDGRTLKLMEVCGSHTAAISKFGIRGMLSPKIRLVSGPGCPVCVTPSAYIDRLLELAKEKDTCVVTFGDMLRVPGSRGSLSAARGEGASVEMVYSPLDTLKLAAENPGITYVFAAVGFETTAPVYTLLLEEAIRGGFTNIRLLTALKTMPQAIRNLMQEGGEIDGFLAPGHVCAVIGSDAFLPLAKEFQIPFAVSGFGDRELLLAIYGLVRMAKEREAAVKNFYPSVVTPQGNLIAKKKLETYFMPCDAVWRGMGNIPLSGLLLKDAYKRYDAGSASLIEDKKLNHGCRCDKILTGKLMPQECPLFGRSCTPGSPQGACMVSYEGSCYQNYLSDGGNA